MKGHKNTDIHHLICSSRQDEGFDTNADINKEEWAINKHRSIHSLFVNLLPHESIEKYIKQYYGAVLRPEFKAKIQEILNWDKEDIYVDEVLKIQSETKQKVMDVLEQEFNAEFAKEMEKPLDTRWLEQFYNKSLHGRTL